MRKMLPLILALPLLASPAAAIESPQTAPITIVETAAPITKLPGWMSGCWMADGEGESRTEECWTLPRGQMMLGSSHTFVGDQSRWFEHARIMLDTDGRGMAYVAQPGGAPPTSFSAVSSGADFMEFRNEANDYPQRIRYWREGNLLHAGISMADGSRAQSWSFRSLSGG